MANELVFWTIGCELTKHYFEKSDYLGIRRFRSFFGLSSNICEKVWSMLDIPNSSEPKHLLWCLLFLKQYNVEEINRGITGADEKTYRKWVWIFVNLIADLNIVNCV